MVLFSVSVSDRKNLVAAQAAGTAGVGTNDLCHQETGLHIVLRDLQCLIEFADVQELKKPIRNVVNGQLPRTLLIQVRKPYHFLPPPPGTVHFKTIGFWSRLKSRLVNGTVTQASWPATDGRLSFCLMCRCRS